MICPICGKRFKQNESYRKKTYCSMKCIRYAMNEKAKKQRRETAESLEKLTGVKTKKFGNGKSSALGGKGVRITNEKKRMHKKLQQKREERANYINSLIGRVV